MKTYEFKCKECGETYEFTERKPAFKCCSIPLSRVWTIAGIHYSGSGFYTTDSRRD